MAFERLNADWFNARQIRARPLTIAPMMPHRLRVDGRELYGWCAWDTLFLPELLGVAAEVGSACRASGAPVRLRVTPRDVQSAEPAGVLVSFLLPEAEAVNADVITSFSHYVHFFSSRDAAQPWLDAHPETFLLPLADGKPGAASIDLGTGLRMSIERAPRSKRRPTTRAHIRLLA
jgi:alkylmercury lyase